MAVNVSDDSHWVHELDYVRLAGCGRIKGTGDLPAVVDYVLEQVLVESGLPHQLLAQFLQVYVLAFVDIGCLDG